MVSTVVTTIGVGVSLAAGVLNGQRSLRTGTTAVEPRLGKRMDDTKSELRAEMNASENRIGTRIELLEERVDGLDDRFSEHEGWPSGHLRAAASPAAPGPDPGR